MNDRKIKAVTETFKMIDYRTTSGVILIRLLNDGETYFVNITKEPSCSCSDSFEKKQRCKHIHHALMKIIRVDEGVEDKQEYTIEEIKSFRNKFLGLDHGYERYIHHTHREEKEAHGCCNSLFDVVYRFFFGI